MKKILLLCFLSHFTTTNAQDYLVNNFNDTLCIVFTAITPNCIQYQKWNYPKSQLYIFEERKFKKFSFNLDSMHQVQKDILDSILTNKMTNPEIDKMAKIDANIYYKLQGGAATGIFFGSFLGIVPGLIGAIAASSKPPKFKNLNMPNLALKKNEEYHMAYSKEAFHIKRKRVWSNFAGGVALISIIAIPIGVSLAENGP